VDPLGDVLIKLFPDGFRLLFAPAAALPALLLIPLLVELPVVAPFVEEPVVVPDAADPPVAEPPPAEPPACANATVLVSVSIAANANVLSFIVVSIFVVDQGQTAGRIHVPPPPAVGSQGRVNFKRSSKSDLSRPDARQPGSRADRQAGPRRRQNLPRAPARCAGSNPLRANGTRSTAGQGRHHRA
jgi:hypothetical protein